MFVSIEYSKRGDLNISIESPQGTDVVLFHPRQNDFDKKDGFENFPLVSVHTWGENPYGIWKLRLRDDVTATLFNLKIPNFYFLCLIKKHRQIVTILAD